MSEGQNSKRSHFKNLNWFMNSIFEFLKSKVYSKTWVRFFGCLFKGTHPIL